MNSLHKFHSWRRKWRWNRQYKGGRWEKLKGEKESGRYQKIIDYITEFGNENPSILDLGCGEGILCERLKNSHYSSFLGIDFSSVSIKNAKKLNIQNAEFICANIHDFQPNKKFDVVVFNEVFYYLQDNQKQNVLDKITECLSVNGIIVISMYREKPECWNYFKNFEQLDFTSVITDEERMYWKVGVFKKNINV